MGLKVILFDFKERQLCDALTDATVLTSIYACQVNIMKKLRRSTLDDMDSKKM